MSRYLFFIKNNRYFPIGIILFPFLLSLIVLFCIRKPAINLTDTSQFRIFEFSDVKDGGNSSCSLENKQNTLTVKTTLHKKYLFFIVTLIQ